MSNLELIDLVICSYNNAVQLDRVLDAIASQVVPPDVQWSVLVVNNNCTDHTSDIVGKHRQMGKIPGLREIKETRQGLTHARHSGVADTRSEWIAFVDDDCLLDPFWVANAARFAGKYPRCGAFGGKVILNWEIPPDEYVKNFGYSFAEQNHGDDEKQVDCLVGAGLVVKREALSTSGWTTRPLLEDRTGSRLVSGGDVEIALRIRGSSYELWYDPACRLDHIIPPHRTTLQYLVDVNFGLGKSKLLGDSLLWKGSYGHWFLDSIGTAIRFSTSALFENVSKEELSIRRSFARGLWMGIWSIVSMDREKRQELLGSAYRLHGG